MEDPFKDGRHSTARSLCHVNFEYFFGNLGGKSRTCRDDSETPL